MKNTMLPAGVLSLLLMVAGAAQAQDQYAFGFRPGTGDVWVDARLGDFNVFAAGNTDGFIDEVVVSYGAPRYLVHDYVVVRRWPPGDVYYACALAHYSHRPCLEVLQIWEHDHGQGWGAVAKRLGIKPGSPAFHALKGGVGQSHGKWQDGPHGKSGHAGPSGAGPDHGPPGKKGKGKGKGKDKGPPHG